jgi:hypothetical protein
MVARARDAQAQDPTFAAVFGSSAARNSAPEKSHFGRATEGQKQYARRFGTDRLQAFDSQLLAKFPSATSWRWSEYRPGAMRHPIPYALTRTPARRPRPTSPVDRGVRGEGRGSVAAHRGSPLPTLLRYARIGKNGMRAGHRWFHGVHEIIRFSFFHHGAYYRVYRLYASRSCHRA